MDQGGRPLPAPGLLLEEPLGLPRGEVGTGPALTKGSELSPRAQPHPDRDAQRPPGLLQRGVCLPGPRSSSFMGGR